MALSQYVAEFNRENRFVGAGLEQEPGTYLDVLSRQPRQILPGHIAYVADRRQIHQYILEKFTETLNGHEEPARRSEYAAAFDAVHEESCA